MNKINQPSTFQKFFTPLLIVVFFMLLLAAILKSQPTFKESKITSITNFGEIKNTSNQILSNLENLSSLESRSDSLGALIRKSDEAILMANFKKAYELRSEKMKAIIPYKLANSLYQKNATGVKSIFILGVQPLQKEDHVSRILLIKTAEIPNQNSGFHWIFYIETWSNQDGQWRLNGGAPWDQPALPIN